MGVRNKGGRLRAAADGLEVLEMLPDVLCTQRAALCSVLQGQDGLGRQSLNPAANFGGKRLAVTTWRRQQNNPCTVLDSATQTISRTAFSLEPRNLDSQY